MYFPPSLTIPEPIRLQIDSERLADQISGLRSVSGVYTLISAGAHIHLSWSTNLERRLKRLLLLSYPGSRPFVDRLGKKLDAVECWPTGSRLELSLLLYGLAKKFYPERYLKFLRLRMPWFLGLTAQDPFPGLEVVNRFPRRFSAFWGPFPSRGAAQQYEQEVLSLFQIRRCSGVLVPGPEHPGCIYGEMSQCLRPCQCVVTVEEYGREADRVKDLLRNNGRSALAALSAARDRACEEMEFEQAALMHKRSEKIKAAAQLCPSVVEDIERFNGVALTAAVARGQFILWPMLQGYWQEPVVLNFLNEAVRRTSLDAEIRQLLEQRLSDPRRQGNRIEEMALFSRWYYSSWRDGDWYPFAAVSDLNYRKLVREISKLALASSTPAN
jgi:excinuclease ABC subunit C